MACADMATGHNARALDNGWEVAPKFWRTIRSRKERKRNYLKARHTSGWSERLGEGAFSLVYELAAELWREGGAALLCCGHASDPRRQHHPPAPPSSPNANAAHQLGMVSVKEHPVLVQQHPGNLIITETPPSTVHPPIMTHPSPSANCHVRDLLPPPAEVPQPVPKPEPGAGTTRQDPAQMPAPPWPITTNRDPTPRPSSA